jgi:hypothetical protein
LKAQVESPADAAAVAFATKIFDYSSIEISCGRPANAKNIANLFGYFCLEIGDLSE